MLANDLAWHEGVAEWLPLSQIPGLLGLPPLPVQGAVLPTPYGLSEANLLQQTDFILLPDEKIIIDGWVYSFGYDRRNYCYVTSHRLVEIKKPSFFGRSALPGIHRMLMDLNKVEKPTRIKYQIPWTRLTGITKERTLVGANKFIFKSSDGQTIALIFLRTLFSSKNESSWLTALRTVSQVTI